MLRRVFSSKDICTLNCLVWIFFFFFSPESLTIWFWSQEGLWIELLWIFLTDYLYLPLIFYSNIGKSCGECSRAEDLAIAILQQFCCLASIISLFPTECLTLGLSTHPMLELHLTIPSGSLTMLQNNEKSSWLYEGDNHFIEFSGFVDS